MKENIIEKKKKIVSIGALNVDSTIFIDDFSNEGQERIIREQHIFSGGKAGNVAAGLGILDNNVYFFGNIGNDHHTNMLIRDLNNSNVNYDFAVHMIKPNNLALCIVNKFGRTHLYSRKTMEFDEKDFSEKLYDEAEYFIFSSIMENGIEIYTNIAKKAKQKGIKTFFNPGNIFSYYDFDKLSKLLENMDYILIKKSEMDRFLKKPENNKIFDVIEHIIVRDVDNKLTYYIDGKKKYEIDNIIHENIIDTSGARDCFIAGFITSLIEEKDELESIYFGLCAATLSVRKKGSRSMPKREEIIGHMKKYLN